MADEKNSDIDIDDWLDDLDDSEEEPAAEASAGEEAEDAALEEELDQSDIDKLLGGEDGLEEADESVGMDEEIDQADIDKLLGGGEEESSEAQASAAGEEAAPAAEPEEDDEFGQSDIDSLLNEEDSEAGVEAGEGSMADAGDTGSFELDQDEMDKLFASDDEEEGEDLFASKEVDFAEILSDDEESESGLDFSDDAGGLDFDSDDEKTVLDSSGGQPEAAGASEEEGGRKAFVLPPFVQNITHNKSVSTILVICLIVLLGLGGYYFFKPGEEAREAAIKISVEDKGQEVEETKEGAGMEEAEQMQANTVPVVKGDIYQMGDKTREINILLNGKDDDNDALSFEVLTPPKHGRLSGTPPELVYLPNKNFPGEDRFEFRSSDGKAFSAPATIMITGPNLAKAEEKKEKAKPKPKRIRIAAKDVKLVTVSTEPVAINWQQIWKKANSLKFSDRVTVEIVDKKLSGQLKKTGKATYLYTPDKFFSGEDLVKYRFKRGKIASSVKSVYINVILGSPAPEIHLKEMAEAYKVGGTVVIDVSGTRDESRESVEFAWEQLAGVPVQLEALNREGSVVAFVMPSSFYLGEESGPLMRVTAIDKTGKTDSKELKIPARTRRQTALWRGIPGDGIAPEPDCPRGECPGELLPWPYRN